jgi:hypothetical protein
MIVLCSTSRVIKNRHFDGISVLLCREHRYHLTARIFCNHSHDRHSTNCFWSPIDVSLYGTNRLPCVDVQKTCVQKFMQPAINTTEMPTIFYWLVGFILYLYSLVCHSYEITSTNPLKIPRSAIKR